MAYLAPVSSPTSLTNDYVPQSTSRITNWLEHHSLYFKHQFLGNLQLESVLNPYFDKRRTIYLTDVSIQLLTEQRKKSLLYPGKY